MISNRKIGGAPQEPLYLVDGDILVYRCAAATDGRHYMVGEDGPFAYLQDAKKFIKDTGSILSPSLEFLPEPVSHTIQLMKNYLEVMPNRKIFLSDRRNFRYDLLPEYKAARKKTRKPANLSEAKNYLMDYQNAAWAENLEADDLMVIESYYLDKEDIPWIIASPDKDLRQRAGAHYDFIRDQYEYISEADARKNFWIQVCVGDTTDGIISPRGLGPVTAEGHYAPRIDWEVSSDREIWETTLELYKRFMKQEPKEAQDAYEKRVRGQLNQVASLVYLLKDYDDEWIEPEETKETSENKEATED